MASKLPVILQTEVTECGLACVAMIGRYWGHDIDLNVLRKKFLISLKGATLKSVMSVASSLELAPRPLRLEMEHLPELKLPAVLHWDLDHFVVLKAIKGDKAHIHDPALGLRIMPLSQVSRHFTGVALEMMPTAEFKPVKARLKAHIRLLWQRLVGLKRALLQTLILSLILQFVVLTLPFYLQLVVDGVLPNSDHKLLWALLIGFASLAILRALAEATRSWAILVYGNQMSAQMIGNVFRHLIRLPTGYFEKRHVGDLISRMNSTIPIQEALTQSVVAILIDGAMAALMLAVMFLYSPLLGTIVLVSVLLLIGITLLIYPHLRRTQEEAIYKKAMENTHVIESIRASTTVKLFGRETAREAHWRNLYMDFINADLDHGRFKIAQKFAETLIVGLQIIIVVYAAAAMMLEEGSAFTVGMLVAFLAYRQYFTDSVTQLIEKGIEFRLLSLHLDRLADIIFAEKDTELSGTLQIEKFEGAIEIKDLSFRYSPLDPFVLEDFDLEIKAGQMVTLTGRSGGGKTTLLKLILGLYQPTQGTIKIDGLNLSDLEPESWRGHIGVVMQDDQLLTGSIAENISFFDPEIDMAKVEQAAKRAQIHEEIASIPMGYQSLVGNMGSILSGGQKQRVLLARALYHDPHILFLDEGTANLDVETEKQIVDVVTDMPITRLIVAHRPAFLERSDVVITL